MTPQQHYITLHYAIMQSLTMQAPGSRVAGVAFTEEG